MNKLKLFIFFFLLLFFALFSCEGVIMETDITNKKVVIVAPYDKAQFFSTGVIFSWESIPDATKYHLQIAKPNFANPLQIVLDTTVTSISFTQQLPVGDYEWRVSAINSAYKTSFTNRFFSVASNENFQDNIVVLNSPINNFTTNLKEQNLKWMPIIGATNYQVVILDGSDAVVSDQTVTTSTLNYSFKDGNYYWKIKAINGNLNTVFTSRSIIIDSGIPNTPVLATPLNASTTTSNNVVFNWNRVPVAGSKEKDSLYVYADSGLSTLLLKSEVINSFNKTLDSGTYYWFVKSFDFAGNVSEKSSVFSFKID